MVQNQEHQKEKLLNVVRHKSCRYYKARTSSIWNNKRLYESIISGVVID
jgi:hypothetical protein